MNNKGMFFLLSFVSYYLALVKRGYSFNYSSESGSDGERILSPRSKTNNTIVNNININKIMSPAVLKVRPSSPLDYGINIHSPPLTRSVSESIPPPQ